jgi:hypothetical protein
MKWTDVVWALLVILAIPTLYLAVTNRASVSVRSSLPVALVAGVAGGLVTLILGLKASEKSSSFPVEYVLGPPVAMNGLPDKLVLPFSSFNFPEVAHYADAGGDVAPVTPSLSVEALEVEPRRFSASTDDALRLLYRRVLLRQMLDTLRFTYKKSWDAQPTRFAFGTGGSNTNYGPRTERADGTKLRTEEISRNFGGDAFVSSSSFGLGDLQLPPDSKFSGSSDGTTTSVRVTNPFMQVEIKITDAGVAEGLGYLRKMCKISHEEDHTCRRAKYFVNLSAEFSAHLSGHPDMPLYAHWAEIMFSELERFSSTQRWATAKDVYLSVRANQDKTDMQELMEETMRKAAQQPGKDK